MKTSKKSKIHVPDGKRIYHTGPGETIEIPNVVTPTSKTFDEIYDQYKADRQAGYISNMDLWLDSSDLLLGVDAKTKNDIKLHINKRTMQDITTDRPDHVHIPIKHGHITWTGEKPPTKEQIEAFEGLADFIFNHPEKIQQMSIRKALKKAHKKTGIPMVCLPCGSMNSENCNTCQKPYEK